MLVCSPRAISIIVIITNWMLMMNVLTSCKLTLINSNGGYGDFYTVSFGTLLFFA